MMMRHGLLRALLLAGLVASAVFMPGAAAAGERTSRNNKRLAGWLKQFPEADADKDGVLTAAEAEAYARKLVDSGRRPAGKGGLSWRIQEAFFSMRSARPPSPSRRSSCGCFKSKNLKGLGVPRQSRWTFG